MCVLFLRMSLDQDQKIAASLHSTAPTGDGCTPASHHSTGRALARLQLLILIHPPPRKAEWRCSSGEWRAAPFDAVEHAACRSSRSRPEGSVPGWIPERRNAEPKRGAGRLGRSVLVPFGRLQKGLAVRAKPLAAVTAATDMYTEKNQSRKCPTIPFNSTPNCANSILEAAFPCIANED